MCHCLKSGRGKKSTLIVITPRVKESHLPNTLKILTSGGYPDAEIAKSTSRDMGIMGANHEEADIHLILYGMVVASTGFSRLEVICQYTDVFLMLIHFLRDTNKEILYNGYISRDLYFPKKDEFQLFPVFNFPSPHTAALILILVLMLATVLAPESLLLTTVCVLTAYVQTKLEQHTYQYKYADWFVDRLINC